MNKRQDAFLALIQEKPTPNYHPPEEERMRPNKLSDEYHRLTETLTAIAEQLSNLQALKRRAEHPEDQRAIEEAEQKALLLRDYLLWRQDQIRQVWTPSKYKKKRRSIIR